MSNQPSPLIVIAGGGTGGPVTPLLAVAAAIRVKRPEARFLGIGTSYGPEAKLMAAAGLPFVAIPAGKLRRYFTWRNFLVPGEVLAGLVRAWFIIGETRPAAVVSAGGFVAAPVIWAAWLRRVPVHVHQQDIRPTLTNVLTLPFAASLSVAFDKSVADFQRYHPLRTGNPVRPAVFAGTAAGGRQRFGLEPGVPTVLVMGGGTGAVNLNTLVRRALPLLTPACQIIHVAGPGKMEEIPEAPSRYHQYELLTDELPDALAVADLVVSRAGIGSLSELAVLGKPTVIVPIPGSHQEDNARYFAAAGAGVYLDERQTFSKHFADTIQEILNDAPRRQALSEAMRTMNRSDAAARVAAAVLALV